MRKVFKNGSSGFSLISVLIALGLAGILATVVARLSNTTTRSLKSSRERFDLELIRRTVYDNIDCLNSLNLTNFPSAGLRCQDYQVINLRRRDGRPLSPIGPWTVSAGCDNNEIVVKATRDGVDPLTKQPWSELPTADDLYNGISDICSAFFETNLPLCPAPSVLKGYAGGVPVCGESEDLEGKIAIGKNLADCANQFTQKEARRQGVTVNFTNGRTLLAGKTPYVISETLVQTEYYRDTGGDTDFVVSRPRSETVVLCGLK